MPAPDLETLLAFEARILPAFRTRLTALGVGKVALRQDTGALASGRVDAELVMGTATGSLFIPDNLPEDEVDTRACLENAWHAVATFAAVTDRDVNRDLHATFLGKVRATMLTFFSGFGSDVLPWHEIALVRTAGTELNLETAKNEDVSRLHYALVIAIRPDAWPAPFGAGN